LSTSLNFHDQENRPVTSFSGPN